MAHCCNFAGRGSLPPPCRPVEWRQGACRPAGGRQAPAKGLRANNFFYLYISPYRPPAVRQAPCRPPSGR